MEYRVADKFISFGFLLTLIRADTLNEKLAQTKHYVERKN